MAESISVHARIKGKVQGVFFRLETQKTALKLGVGGWVRNLPSGEVEALFEAPPETIEKMIQWCRKGPSAASVSEVVTTPRSQIEGFTSFDVRY